MDWSYDDDEIIIGDTASFEDDYTLENLKIFESTCRLHQQ